MLLKENRLRNKKDFDKVFKEGRGFKEDFLYLKFRNNNSEVSRFGFIVSQKISKKAVIRNKLKRRLREIINTEMARIKNGIDVVLITSPGLENRDFQKLKEIVVKTLAKARIRKDV
ncbi:MAG: ribonuclease P protein component [bacterium]